MITSGELPPDTKLPSERELSRELDISRMTVRRAITELVNEGILDRRHGAGTFVAKQRLTYDVREVTSFANAMEARGMKVSTQMLEFSQVPAGRRLAERLAVDIGTDLYLVVRLRLANRVPILYERSFIPCMRSPGLEEFDLEKTRLYDLLTQHYQFKITNVSQTIESVTAGDDTSKQLRIDEGDPLLLISRILRNGQRLPIMYSQDFLRADYVRMSCDIEY
jgi:GntR family transcriptional regulator